MRNQTPTAIERRISAIEQLPQPSAFDPAVRRRDPRDLTSFDASERIHELRAKARRLSLEKQLGRVPTPQELSAAVERDRAAREARLDTLAAQLAFPAGTPQSEIDAYTARKAAARSRRMAELAIPDNEDQDDEQ